MTLAETFTRLKERRELGLIPYLTAGFPTLAESMDQLRVLADHGGDILEVGIPFSDPIADGPTIQSASAAALRQGVTLPKTLDALAELQIARPVVLMSYLNPLLAYGRDKLLSDLPRANVTGLIIPDLPADEGEDWYRACCERGLGLIQLVAPTSAPQRVGMIVRRCSGFVYCVSLTGTTGAREEIPAGVGDTLKRIRSRTDLPIAVGFGISRPGQVRALDGLADAAVVGSRIVEAVNNGEDLPAIIRELKEATKELTHVDRHAHSCE